MMGVFEIRREAELFPEEELKNAARAVLASMVSSREETASQEHIFSPAFESRMKPLFRLDRRRNGRRDAMRWAAILLIGALLSGALFLAVDSDARAAFFGWVRTVYEKSIVYEFFYDEPDAQEETESDNSIEMPEIDFSLLPGEYEIELVSKYPFHRTYILTGKSDTFVFECFRIDSITSESVEFKDGFSHEAVSVYCVEADYYESSTGEDCNALLWTDEGAMLGYNLLSYAEKDSIMEIAEKIIKNNCPKTA